MKGKIFNWGNVDAKGTPFNYANPDHRARMLGALQCFVNHTEEVNKKISAALQSFGKSSNFPTSILEVVERFREAPSYDDAWERIFKVRDFTGSRRNGFDVLTVGDGLTFEKVPTGDKARVYSMAGTKTPSHSICMAVDSAGTRRSSMTKSTTRWKTWRRTS